MVTIYDIAKHANVSAMTVSRVINKSGKISDKTKEKVEEAIKELNYIPNKSARSLTSKKTNMLSLLITDITNPFFTKVARGAEDKAMQMGYQIILCNSDENEEKESKYIDMLLSTGVDGVLVTAASDRSKNNIRKLLKHNIPVVLIDRTIPDIDCDQVVSDNEQSTKQLMEHLITQGHQNIAVVNGPLTVSTARERFETYSATLNQHGLLVDEDHIYQSDFQHGDADDIVENVISLPTDKKPTAIFATNNFIAYKLIKSFQERDIRIPEDISIVCFGDLEHTLETSPFLTTASQPAYNYGYIGTQFLIEQINGSAPKEPRKIVLPSNILLRKSSRHTI